MDQSIDTAFIPGLVQKPYLMAIVIPVNDDLVAENCGVRMLPSSQPSSNLPNRR